LVGRHCQQRFDRPPDPLPHAPPLVVAAVEHQVLEAGGFKPGVGAVLSDQQVRGAPDSRDRRSSPTDTI
jgi:hypothetical protein